MKIIYTVAEDLGLVVRLGASAIVIDSTSTEDNV